MQRALRAEAEAAAARVRAAAHQLELEARVRELQRALDETTESISWRITAPFRLRHPPARTDKTVITRQLGAGLASAETPSRQ
jgi:hypothetical protein